MASRQNHNAKKANTYNIVVKAAEKIRTVIKQGLYEMWKVRNDIKHEKQAQETDRNRSNQKHETAKNPQNTAKAKEMRYTETKENGRRNRVQDRTRTAGMRNGS